MDKKLINEEIQNMKFLFGYKPGRVISEQEMSEKRYGSFGNLRRKDFRGDEYVRDNDSFADDEELFGIGDDNMYDTEEFDDFESYNERYPMDKEDSPRWFKGSDGKKMFDTYREKSGKPFKVKTRKGEMDEDLEFEEEETMESILEKHNLLDEILHKGDNRIMIQDKSSEVVQRLLSILHLLTELKFLSIVNCESADFSDVDICGLPELAFVNLQGTENNFEEQGYECAIKETLDDDSYSFYYIS
jgi:hypothetical protein